MRSPLNEARGGWPHEANTSDTGSPRPGARAPAPENSGRRRWAWTAFFSTPATWPPGRWTTARRPAAQTTSEVGRPTRRSDRIFGARQAAAGGLSTGCARQLGRRQPNRHRADRAAPAPLGGASSAIESTSLGFRFELSSGRHCRKAALGNDYAQGRGRAAGRARPSSAALRTCAGDPMSPATPCVLRKNPKRSAARASTWHDADRARPARPAGKTRLAGSPPPALGTAERTTAPLASPYCRVCGGRLVELNRRPPFNGRPEPPGARRTSSTADIGPRRVELRRDLGEEPSSVPTSRRRPAAALATCCGERCCFGGFAGVP